MNRGIARGRQGVIVQVFVALAVLWGGAALGIDQAVEQSDTLQADEPYLTIQADEPYLSMVNPRQLMLPEWVQSFKPTTVWSDPARTDPARVTLPAFHVLRVFDAEAGRLLVGDADGSFLGWIAIKDVKPSDPPATWLQNHTVTAPYLGPEVGAARAERVPQWTFLRQVGPQVADRIPVQAEPRNERPSPIVWVQADHLGNSGAPPRVVYSGSASTGAPQAAAHFGSQESFIQAVGEVARSSQRLTNIPASVTVAQAILESDWGRSALSRLANNYFGIKATGRIGSGGVIWMKTWEHLDGEDVYIREPFRAYGSMAESIEDHARLFTGLRLYSTAMAAVNDPLEFARAIHRAGYSTDPNYVAKLVQLMDRYGLGRYDA